MDKNEKSLEKFLAALTKINAIEFFGVATLLKVDCFLDEERKEPKDVDEIISEMIDAFGGLERKQRKELLRDLGKAGRK